jgi:hypothetical protein
MLNIILYKKSPNFKTVSFHEATPDWTSFMKAVLKINKVRKMPQEEWDKLANRFACLQQRFPVQTLTANQQVRFWNLSEYNSEFGTDFPGTDFIREEL